MDADTDTNTRNRAPNPHAASGIALVVRLGFFVVACVVAWAAGSGQVGEASAQAAPAAVEVTGTALADGTVTASVAVLDSASNPIVGLTAADFSIQIDGVAVSGATVASGVDAALPLGIILTVDTSGSMAGEALAAAKQAILPLVEALQASDQAALVTFANEVTEAVPLTGDKATLSSAIDGMNAVGNTALFAAVSRASEVAAAAPQPRRAVVLLSDGEDFGAVSGAITSADALAAAGTSGVPFFVVGLGQEVDQPFLTSLANNTGGQYFAAADPEQLAQLYGRISDRLRQQYTVSVTLPEGIAGGTHRLTVTVGRASGFGSFDTADAPATPSLTLGTLPELIDEPTVLTVAGRPSGTVLRFEIDGEAVESAQENGVRIDPYAFAPGEHTLVVRTDPESDVPPVETTFQVAPLPPLLVAPTAIPELRPGDLVRLTVQAQPGDVVVRARVDGEEVYLASEPPYEFVLPDEDYESGEHTLSVTVESNSGSDDRTFAFQGPPEPGTNYAAYILIALVALALVVAAAFGGRRAFAWYRNRPGPIDTTGVGDQLAAWSELRRGRGDLDEPAADAGAGAVQPGAWGTVTVVSGPDAGARFDLRDDTELVGRGRFCSIRLTDPKVEEAHFVLSRSGRLSASTPAARVTVDGQEIRTVLLGSQAAQVSVGGSGLTISLGEPPESEV